MCDLPTGWVERKLGSLCSITTGKKDVNEGNLSGEFPFFTCSRNHTWSDSYSFDTEAILIAGNGDVGWLNYYNGKFEAYQRTYVLNGFQAGTAYLRHYISGGLRKRLERQHAGSVIQFIKFSDLDDFPVRLPKSGVEQRLIARILDTLDTQIQKTETLIAKLEKVKEGLLHDLLTRGIDESGQLRPSREQAPELYKESPLGLIPKEWGVSTIGERLSQYGGFVQTGPFGSQLHADEYVNNGIPVVMPQDMREIEVSKKNIAQISESRARDLSRHRVNEGDLLFSRRGDLSRCSFISEANKGWLCGTGCLLLRPTEHINGYWLANIYKQLNIQSQVYGMAVGSTMVNLNTSILANIVVPDPALQEQNQVADAIRSSKSKILDETKVLNKLKLQKTGLMNDLLTGRVRVTPILEKAQATTPA